MWIAALGEKINSHGAMRLAGVFLAAVSIFIRNADFNDLNV